MNLQQGIIKDLFVKLLPVLKQSYLVKIATNLLHANHKENLISKFFTNKQNRILRAIYIFHVAMTTAHTSAQLLKK